MSTQTIYHHARIALAVMLCSTGFVACATTSSPQEKSFDDTEVNQIADGAGTPIPGFQTVGTAVQGQRQAPEVDYEEIEVPYVVDFKELERPTTILTFNSVQAVNAVAERGIVLTKYSKQTMVWAEVSDANDETIGLDMVGVGKKSLRFNATNTARAFVTSSTFIIGGDSTALVYRRSSECPGFDTLVTNIRAARRIEYNEENGALRDQIWRCVLDKYRPRPTKNTGGIRAQSVLDGYGFGTSWLTVNQEADGETVVIRSYSVLSNEYYVFEGESVTPDMIDGVKSGTASVTSSTDAPRAITGWKIADTVLNDIPVAQNPFRTEARFKPEKCKVYVVVACTSCGGGNGGTLASSAAVSNAISGSG
jgi:hypothetical protein